MLNRFAGGIVEIGAGYGESTKVFLEAAERFNRKVLVVDPWDFHDGVKQHDRADSTYGYTYERFMQNVGGNPRLSVCRNRSLSEQASQAIRAFLPAAVLMADGGMNMHSTLNDLWLADDCNVGVIVVDDYLVRSEPTSEFIGLSHRYGLRHDGRAHEAYLIKK